MKNRFSFIIDLAVRSMLAIGIIAITIFIAMKVTSSAFGEGSPQFRPDTTKVTYLMVLNTQPTYGTFAGYSATDNDRLFIRINNPATERIYFGIGNRTTTTAWYFRVKDPNGNVVYGPTLLPTSGTGFIQYHSQAIAGPSTFSPQGYTPFVITPTTGLPGNYYIEFNQGSGTSVSNNREIGLGIFDITVGVPSTSTVIPGRIFSYNWSFNTNSYANEFFGSFFIYGADSSVTKVDLNGIKPFKFRVSCNSFGALNTGNATVDRRSQLGFHVPPELRLFLRDPDHFAFPNGTTQFINGTISLVGCTRDSLCIQINLVKRADVTILIDRNNNNVYDPGTADRLLVFPGVDPGSHCLPWDGRDGLGNYVPVGGTIHVQISVESGEVNLPMFDVENHPTGFSMSIVRPAGGIFVDSLFYDDVLVGGSTNLGGCPFPCHTWVSNPPNSQTNTIGENNTINTYWFARKQSVNADMVMPDYLITNAGADQALCLSLSQQDTIQLSGSIQFSTASYNGSRQWTTSGSGTFIPNDSTFNAQYVPSSADMNAGGVWLVLGPRYVCDYPVDSVWISLNKTPLANPTSTSVGCFGSSTGSVSIAVSNGLAPYSYAWSNGASTQNISGVSSGMYTVTVTGANGCSSTVNASISQPAASLAGNVTGTTNISCFGFSNGSVNFNASGGTAPYTYNWSNGSTSSGLSGVAAGTYSVTVTDANGCTSVTNSITLTAPSAPLAVSAGSISSVFCYSGNNGSISLNVSGGTSPYTFLWSNGSTSQNISALTSGTYTVTATDVNGCSSIQSMIINQPSAALNSTASITQQVSCYGGNNGSIDLSVNGGTSPYTYLWSNGGTTQDISSLSSGNYTVTITDANGCTTQQNASVTQPVASLTPSIGSSQNVNCFSGSNGSIAIAVSGGTSPYNYSWSNGQTTQNLSGLSSGAYTVTVYDANGCTASQSVSITQPAAALNAATTVSQSVNCFGGSNGAISLSVNGGTSPYSYNWSNGSSSQNISGLTSGTYSVTVTDANGCTSQQSSVISQPSAALSSNANSIQQVSCFGGSNGQISISVAGGTSPYSFIWSNGQTTQNISNLPSGTFTVTVTDVNGCVSNNNASVTQPAAALTGSTSVTSNISCFSGNNGAIDLTVAGGTGPFTFSWSTGATTEDLTGLSAGVYTVTITDANGCTALSSGTITQPVGELSTNINISQNIPCYGGGSGAINLTVSGGTMPYSFIWSTGATTEDISNLAAGVYTVTISDANGCNTTASGTITQPSAPLASSINSTQAVLCFGGNNGSMDIDVSGGTFPYSYNWSNGQTTQDIFNLSFGTYTVTITDANGCTTVQSGTVLQPSAPITSSATATQQVLCYGGNNASINLTVNGGTTPYTYNWSNGSTIQNLTGLTVGTYTVTITDDNGCIATQSVTITQPVAALSAGASSIQQVLCFGGNSGSATVNANGGTAPYIFNWSNGANTQSVSGLTNGTYTVTVTDANGCSAISNVTISQPISALSSTATVSQNVSCFGGANGSIVLSVNGGTAPYSYLWNNGSITQNLNALSAGTYTVTVTDANGCTSMQTRTVNQPVAALSGSASASQNVSCYGGTNGTIQLTVSGGTAPYTYNWNTGSTSQNLIGLSSGNYTVTVSDANGCSTVQSASVVQPSAALAVTANVNQNVSCFGGTNGSVNLNVSGGTAPYTYNWSNGSSTQNLSGLTAGVYTITVTDANGCTFMQVANVGQPAASLNSSLAIAQNVLCYSGSNGEINLTVTGGTSPYTYSWSNGASSQNINNLSSGLYTVTITDANGCTNNASASISQPTAALNGNTSVSQNVSCFGGNNGSTFVTVSGGTVPYSYNWSNGSTASNLSGLVSGTYSVTVTDANGCVFNTSAIVSQPAAALASSTNVGQSVNCFGGNNGSISTLVSGGTAPYTYNWSNGSTTQNQTGLGAGNYTVTVTDINGCSSVSSASVIQPDESLTSSGTVDQDVSCFAGSNGALTVNVSGGTYPYTYVWNTGASSQDIIGLSAGMYTVTVTDANGCTSVQSMTITQPAAELETTTSSVQQVSCFGGVNGQLVSNTTGGTAPYQYFWSNGSTTQNISNLTAGVYTITVVDDNGCASESTETITEPSAPLSGTTTTTSNISCFSGNNGSIDLTVVGGTAPYTFNWSTGANTEDLSGLSAGTYSVTITDANGCTTNATGNITQPVGALATNINIAQNIPCFGGGIGAIDLTVTGGTTPYNYTWSTGATTQDINNLPAGVYTVTITDANGCNTSASATITQPSAALASTVSTNQPVLCFGGTSGSMGITTSGGTFPYTYSWSNGETTPLIFNLVSGIYTVTVTDANGCTTIESGVITQPSAALSSSASVPQQVLCFGGSNASVNLTVNGGTTPYSFVWSNGETTQNISGLNAGTYTVTITDANGCVTSQLATVTQPAASLSVNASSAQAVSCYGGSNGAAAVNVNGGTVPYAYLWSNGETTQNISGLATGTYSVSIVDANGCTQSASIFIAEPLAPLAASIQTSGNVNCNGGSNGFADVTVSGGTAPYTYLWNNGETTEDIYNLIAGTYVVDITDANGCTQSISVLISEPITALSANLSVTQQVNCFAGEDGTIDLTPSGGTAPYTFLWSNGETTEDISQLFAGTYTVTVTDANGCIFIDQIDITQPVAPLLGNISVVSNVFCNGGASGSLDLTVNGGTPPYSFLWNTGATTEDISNLATGVYTVTVTDGNGCTTSVTNGIGQPSQQLQATSVIQDVLCFNGNNGLIDITPSGGTPPYIFIWNTGATTEDLGGLIAGTYTITISDANGCDTSIVSVVTQPLAPLIPNLTVGQNVSCFGGSDGFLNLGVTGGTPPYVYLWNNGATSQNNSNLPAGTYTVTVTDANGCNAIINEVVTQPAAPLASGLSISQNVSCYNGSNGSISNTVTGGTPPYSYLWSTGANTSGISNLATGTYTVTVTDNNGCTFSSSATIMQPMAPLTQSGSTTIANCLYGIGGSATVNPGGGTPPYSYSWSNGATTPIIANAMPGTYTVTVTDANGCTSVGSYTIGNESPIQLQTGPTTICVGDFTTLSVDSIPGATYQWYFTSIPLNGAISNSFITPAAGYYYVSVTTPCGTFNTDSVEIVVKSVDNASISNNQIICPPASVQLFAFGGVTYEWTPPTFISSASSPSPIVSPLQTTTYTVEVTNEWGCKAWLDVDVAVACDTLLVPTGFSPNSDGVNDGYVIDHIDKYPGNKLWVYNRWGNLVYKAKDYDNSWDGTCNVSGIYMGKKLPTGTYFYILDLNDNSKPMSGYLILRR